MNQTLSPFTKPKRDTVHGGSVPRQKYRGENRLRGVAARLVRSRRQIPVILFLVTALPIGLLSYAVYQTQRASQAVADVNWAGSLRDRSLWLYSATTGGASSAQWRPMREKMGAIREDLRTRYPSEVAQTDREWIRFTGQLEATGKVDWDEAGRMKDTADGLAYALQAEQENHNRYVGLLFAMGILSLAVSLPWGLSMFHHLQDAEREAKQQTGQMNAVSERFAALFNGVPVACFAFDGYGRVQDWNRACEALYGLPAKAVLNQPVWNVTVQNHQQVEAEAKMRGVCEQGQAFQNVEWDIVRPDGQKRVVLFSAFPLLAHDQNVSGNGGIGAGIDITSSKENLAELMRRTDELKQSNRELQDFAFVASHDLKEPLRKIQTFGGILQHKAKGELSQANAEYLERILGAARRMQSLIDDILTLARVTMKGKPFEAVPLAELARGVVADMEVSIEANKGSVLVGEMPVVLAADPSQIRQLFQNLISNALKFHKPNVPPSSRCAALWKRLQPANLSFT